MVAVLAALGSALLLAVGSVLQHHAAARAATPTLRRVLRHPIWLVGAVSGVAGFGLHALALSFGSLSLVQPLLVTTLLFALPLGWVLEHRGLHRGDVVAAITVVGGLIVFQLSARESGGNPSPNPVTLGWCVAVVALAGVGAVVAGARDRRRRAGWLGFCAGAAFGLLAALLKASVAQLQAGPLVMLSSWPVYAFAVLVVAAIAVNQLAFNAGPLASSLPLITIVDPVVSVAVGVIAFGETISSQPVLVVGQIAGFAAMTCGVVALSRRQSTDDDGQRTANSTRLPTPAAMQ